LRTRAVGYDARLLRACHACQHSHVLATSAFADEGVHRVCAGCTQGVRAAAAPLCARRWALRSCSRVPGCVRHPRRACCAVAALAWRAQHACAEMGVRWRKRRQCQGVYTQGQATRCARCGRVAAAHAKRGALARTQRVWRALAVCAQRAVCACANLCVRLKRRCARRRWGVLRAPTPLCCPRRISWCVSRSLRAWRALAARAQPARLCALIHALLRVNAVSAGVDAQPH
jgi:hypothetical protein